MSVKLTGYIIANSVQISVTPEYVVPTPSFFASPTTGAYPLTVSFTDTSIGSPSAWLWNFGDGSSSTLQNPTHTFTSAASNSVTLSVSNSAGSNITMTPYHIVTTVPGFSGSTTSSGTYSGLTSNWVTATNGAGIFAQIAFDYPVSQYSLDNGLTWHEHAQSAILTIAWCDMAYGNGTFVAASKSYGTENISVYSTDGINWSQSTLPAAAQWWTVAFGNGQFVMTGQNFATSPDGITWTGGTFGSGVGGGTYQNMCYGNGMFLAFSNTSRTVYSYTGNSHDWHNIPAGSQPSGVHDSVYGNGIFVALVSSDTSWISSDGLHWVAHVSALPVSTSWTGIAFGNGVFVASYGSSTSGTTIGGYASSTDGINWTLLYSGNTVYGQVEYSEGTFLVCGGSNYVLIS